MRFKFKTHINLRTSIYFGPKYRVCVDLNKIESAVFFSYFWVTTMKTTRTYAIYRKQFFQTTLWVGGRLNGYSR